MPIHDGRWAEGTPCWSDLQVDDIAAARAFYEGLFGWEIIDSPEEAGEYLMALKDGQAVAGIGPKTGDTSAPNAWTTYFSVDDVDATTGKVDAADGTVIAEPFDVLTFGRMSVAADSGGAAFGIWEARQHTGYGVVNEHGAVCWNELHTNDYQVAQAFYTAVFGVSFTEIGADGANYSTFSREGSTARENQLGGCLNDPGLLAGAPPHWLTWFAADGIDEAVREAVSLGATVLMGPDDSPFGRMSVIAGPQGEPFGLIDLSTRQG